jgi:hypothetical protein
LFHLTWYSVTVAKEELEITEDSLLIICELPGHMVPHHAARVRIALAVTNICFAVRI